MINIFKIIKANELHGRFRVGKGEACMRKPAILKCRGSRENAIILEVGHLRRKIQIPSELVSRRDKPQREMTQEHKAKDSEPLLTCQLSCPLDSHVV